MRITCRLAAVALLLMSTCIAIFALAAEVPANSAGEDAERHFARRVLPLLQSKCLGCHGEKPGEIKGGLDLTSREALLRGGESGQAAVVPSRPDDSLLFQAVNWDGLEMPPKANDRLTAEQIQAVRRWIADGAPWPDEATRRRLAADGWDSANAGAGVMVPTSGGLTPEWTNRRYKPEDLWAYRPLHQPSVPAVPGANHPIDAFLEAAWAPAALTPAPLADRRTLIRRATFDLIGLPPTPEEIEAFLRDPAPDEVAFAGLVERLLASPHYGEHWARHWLDVVRYADSSGFANDYERGNTWRYRDYVIRAMNADKPYDQFVREQIAGDELDPGNPEMLTAVGFLRMGPWELTGMEVPKVARQRFLDDVTDSVGQVFLGHPLQCARCHDHKFDRIPTRDYYRLQAVFATTQLTERPAPFLPVENQAGFEERKYLEQQAEDYRRILVELSSKSTAAARMWLAERGLDGSRFERAVQEELDAAGKRPGARTNLYEIVRGKLARQGVPEAEIPPRHAGYTPLDHGLDRIARKGLERLAWELDRYEPVAFSVYSGRTSDVNAVYAPQRPPAEPWKKGELEQVAVLAGGDPFSPTIKVEPGALSVVALHTSALDARCPKSEVPNSGSGRRKALAEWIAHPRHPLTARVMVNRIWQGHFGRGLAGNPNNFGATGKKPTHPELLDWLAVAFVERGWSIKAMHRLLMSSAAYRRSAEHPDRPSLGERDPHGTSYAVFQPRRLTAEELRDGMLAVSGELNRTLGGIPIRPEINREAALQPRQVMGTFASAWQPSPKPADRHRRSIYALKIRGLRDPLLEVFNEPSPDLSCEARESSTVTPQAFSLLNSENTTARALAFADRCLRETTDPQQAIVRAFQLAFGRSPVGQEARTCLQRWDEMTARHRQLRFARHAYPTEVTREAVEENTGENFAFVERLHAAADFVPDPQLADAAPETRGLAEVCLVLLNANEFVYVY